MNIPYRTQRTLKRIAIVLLVVTLVAVLVWLCWLLWLNRFVIYTRDGAKLDLNNSSENISGELAVPPVEEEIPIYYNEGDDAVETGTDLTQIIGYYIDTAALQGDLDTIKSQIRSLPAGTPVLMEVKNSFGSLYYSSKASPYVDEAMNPEQIDELIQLMNNCKLYTIAWMPALRDYSYGLEHVECGLPTAGGYLWADEDYRYWLNPGNTGTLAYLISIANELKELGFNEVVFGDFRIPETDSIVFNGDKAQTLADAAQTLVKSCASSSFAVSFESSEGFALPAGRSRLYVKNAVAIDADSIAESAGVEDTAVNLVFVTDLYDTRFDVYSVLRPIASVS